MNFLATLLLAGSALAAPTQLDVRQDKPSCTSAFDGWTLTGLEYHASYIFTTPAHQNSWGYFNFNATNPALDYVVPCSATSNQLSDFFYGTMTYKCPVPEGSGGDVSFTFNRANGLVAMNQTWVCHDDPQWPATFHAGGNATAQLECTDTTTTNPDWELGQIYSNRQVQCKPITLPMNASWIWAVA